MKGKRFFRNKPKSLIGTPYDSMIEKRLHEGVFKDTLFHPKKYVEYSITHTYCPDFVLKNPDGTEFIIDSKGYIQDSSELQKLKNIIEQLEDHQIFVLILEKPNVKLHWLKVRKDGTKCTIEEWCDKNKVMYLYEEEAYKLLED
jgi:hypothetical protein